MRPMMPTVVRECEDGSDLEEIHKGRLRRKIKGCADADILNVLLLPTPTPTPSFIAEMLGQANDRMRQK